MIPSTFIPSPAFTKVAGGFRPVELGHDAHHHDQRTQHCAGEGLVHKPGNGGSLGGAGDGDMV